MTRLVSRITLLGVLSLALTGCLRTLDTAPLQSTPAGAAVAPTFPPPPTDTAQAPVTPEQPTASAPAPVTTEPPSAEPPTAQLPTEPPTLLPTMLTLQAPPSQTPLGNANPANSTPLIEQLPTLTPFPTDTPQPPTIAPTVQVVSATPTATPLPTLTNTPAPLANPTENQPTQPLAAGPTDTPYPLNSLTPTPTDTPIAAVATTATSATSATSASLASTSEASATPTFVGTVISFVPTVAPPMDGASGKIDAQCNYKVEENDRLLRIALRFNRTMIELQRANPAIVNTQVIYIGQTIKIPDCNIR